jgi:WD40 repeat protein
MSVSTLHLWNLKSGQYAGCLAFPQVGLETTTFSPDGKLMAIEAPEYQYDVQGVSSSKLEYIYLVDPQKKRIVAKLSGVRGCVTGLSFSPDGTRVFASTREGGVQEWIIPSSDK